MSGITAAAADRRIAETDPWDMRVITAIKNGDTEQFRKIMDRYEGYVKRIVSRHVPPQEIEDIMQDVFIKTYRSLEGYRGKSPFRSWLASIAVRTCCDYWRGAGRVRLDSIPSHGEQQCEWVRSVIYDTSRQQFATYENRMMARDILNRIYDRLPGEDRIVLNLIYMEECSMKEAANLLGWSVTKTKVKAFRARNRLRKLLEPLIREN